MSPSKRILLLSLKAGAGHIRAAKAIEDALRAKGTCEIRNIEVLEYTHAIYRHGFSAVYGGMIHRCPSLWRGLYERTERQPVRNRFKSVTGAINRISSQRLQREVRRFQPDCIICTHFVPAEIMASASRRGALRATVCVAMTDFELHPMWIHSGVSHYFVATPEMAFELQHKGIGPGQVTVSGIPIFSQFSANERVKMKDKLDLRRHLKLDPYRTTILISGGGCGLGGLDKTVAALAEQFKDAQILAVAGNNTELYESLKTIAKDASGVVPLPFVSNMHELMAASDFAITKPGGLTSSECLAMGLPMILVNPIPGQEERNANYLLESGAALFARFLPNLIHKTGMLLSDTALRERLSKAALAISRPDAASCIADAAMALPFPSEIEDCAVSEESEILAAAAT